MKKLIIIPLVALIMVACGEKDAEKKSLCDCMKEAMKGGDEVPKGCEWIEKMSEEELGMKMMKEMKDCPEAMMFGEDMIEYDEAMDEYEDAMEEYDEAMEEVDQYYDEAMEEYEDAIEDANEMMDKAQEDANEMMDKAQKDANEMMDKAMKDAGL